MAALPIWKKRPWLTMPRSGMGPPAPRRGVWSGNIVPSILPGINPIEDLRKRIPNEFGLADHDNPLYKQVERGRQMNRAGGLGWGPKTDPYLKNYGNLRDADIPRSASSGSTGWDETYVAKPTVPKNKAPTAKKGQTAEEKKAEKDEALKLAWEDAAKYAGAMQGKTIPGVPPGGGSQDHQMGTYGTGGYDLTSNRPTADPDAVRKRLYGIMGFA